MAKLRIQAQHLQPGDIVGSGEVVHSLIVNSVHWSTSKICVRFHSKTDFNLIGREAMWGKYTMINVERPDTLQGAEAIRLHNTLDRLGIK